MQLKFDRETLKVQDFMTSLEKEMIDRKNNGAQTEEESKAELAKARDKTLYAYVETLVNTAKIELESKIRRNRRAAVAAAS